MTYRTGEQDPSPPRQRHFGAYEQKHLYTVHMKFLFTYYHDNPGLDAWDAAQKEAAAMRKAKLRARVTWERDGCCLWKG